MANDNALVRFKDLEYYTGKLQGSGGGSSNTDYPLYLQTFKDINQTTPNTGSDALLYAYNYSHGRWNSSYTDFNYTDVLSLFCKKNDSRGLVYCRYSEEANKAMTLGNRDIYLISGINSLSSAGQCVFFSRSDILLGAVASYVITEGSGNKTPLAVTIMSDGSTCASSSKPHSVIFWGTANTTIRYTLIKCKA